MKRVKVYTTKICSYCSAAKKLLDENNVTYEEIDVSADSAMRQWLVDTTGYRTVPQIFFGDHAIGGYDQLSLIVRKNELQKLLV